MNGQSSEALSAIPRVHVLADHLRFQWRELAVPVDPLAIRVADGRVMFVTSQRRGWQRQGPFFRTGLCTNTSHTVDKSGRPFRMRADHSWPQRRQSYHVMTQVLSAAGSTGRPHMGQDIVAVADNFSNIQTRRATIVPVVIATKWLRAARLASAMRGIYRTMRETPHRAEREVP